ncbi:MAG: hypothetical protein ABI873_15155, partial [Marmoricola sp.]
VVGLMPPEPEVADLDRYRRLPEPIRLDDLRTSADVVPHPDEGSDELREVAWLIRTTGGI